MKLLVVGDFQGKFPEKLKRKLKKEEFDLVLGVGDYSGIKDWYPFIMDMFKRVNKGKERISPEDYFGKNKFNEILRKDLKAGKMVLKELNRLGKPVYFVFGNTDDDWYSYPFDYKFKSDKKKKDFVRKLKNMKEMTYRTRKFENVNFVGCGGYMDIEAFFKEERFKKRGKRATSWVIKRLKRSRERFFGNLKKAKGEKIFVFHYPPMGVFDIIKDKHDNPMNGKSSGVRFFTEAIKKYKPRLAVCGHMHEYRGVKKIGKTIVLNPGDGEEGKAAIVDYPEDKKKKVKVKFIN